MDLVESIRVFKRVAELGSFSAAAQEFKVSQPTMSKAIKSLEEYLGVSLIRRTTRGLSLTSEGQKLIFAGTSLVEQADGVMATMRNEKLQLQGQLRITASLAFARLILTPLLEEFTELHPELKLSFHLSDGYIDLVENGIDLAIRIGELDDSGLKALKVGSFRRGVYASTAYVKRFGKPKSIADLKNHRLLFYTRVSDRPYWSFTHKDGSVERFHFEPHLQTDGSDLMREATLKGIGIAMMPAWMMCEPVKEKHAVKLLVEHTEPAYPIYIVSAGTQEMSAKQRAFTEFLRKHFEKNPEMSMRQKSSSRTST